MLRFHAEHFLAATSKLKELQLRQRPSGESESGIVYTIGSGGLGDLARSLEGLGMDSFLLRVQRLQQDCQKGLVPLSTVLYCLGDLETSLFNELSRRQLYYLEDRYAAFFDASKLSENAAAAFPGVESELREAGSCLALERTTAAVMHGMRALEPLLQSIAADLGVTVPPENWHRLLDQIEAKIRELAGSKKTPSDKLRLSVLSEAATHFRFVKDAWRNLAMHGRQNYDASKAAEILASVRNLAEALAPILQEQ